MTRIRNKKTYFEYNLNDEEHITNIVATALGVELETAKEKLLKEQKRLYSPHQSPEKISVQTVMNCIPRKHKMYKTVETNPISVNTLVNKLNDCDIIILTRSSHGNQRFILGSNGIFFDNVDSSRLFVDIYWIIKNNKRKGKQMK